MQTKEVRQKYGNYKTQLKTCKHCQALFFIEPWRKQDFCSQQCGVDFRKGITKIAKICLECKKTFHSEPWKNQKFCSQQCGVDFRKGITKIAKICLECGKSFYSEPWRSQKFCSVACGVAYNLDRPRSCRSKSSPGRTRNRPERTTIDGRRTTLHRYLMEKKLGRTLLSSETVHHINLKSADNHIDNLYLFKDESSHIKAHRSIEKLVPELLEDGIIDFENGIYVHKSSTAGGGRGGGRGRKG